MAYILKMFISWHVTKEEHFKQHEQYHWTQAKKIISDNIYQWQYLPVAKGNFFISSWEGRKRSGSPDSTFFHCLSGLLTAGWIGEEATQ